MASALRDSFCGCFLSHICTSCTQEGWPLFTNCREGFFSETCIFRTLGNYAVGLW